MNSSNSSEFIPRDTCFLSGGVFCGVFSVARVFVSARKDGISGPTGWGVSPDDVLLSSLIKSLFGFCILTFICFLISVILSRRWLNRPFKI